jgi:hypothetical protein
MLQPPPNAGGGSNARTPRHPASSLLLPATPCAGFSGLLFLGGMHAVDRLGFREPAGTPAISKQNAHQARRRTGLPGALASPGCDAVSAEPAPRRRPCAGVRRSRGSPRTARPRPAPGPGAVLVCSPLASRGLFRPAPRPPLPAPAPRPVVSGLPRAPAGRGAADPGGGGFRVRYPTAPPPRREREGASR